MGEHLVNTIETLESRNSFVKQLLNDIEALELMLEKEMFEDDKIRIGAEQEFFIVNDYWRPSVDSDMILFALNDSHFTTEMTRYTLEINVDPVELKSNCFSAMQQQLKQLLNKADNVAGQYHAKVMLAGILPTISKNEVALKYMTPLSRYHVLNENTKKLRGSDFSLHIKGIDELTILHDTILFEGCNASFQMHLQIPPKDFIASYNWSQAIAGPVLAICTNSPLLMGRELWGETRIALFQQSVDTRASSYALTEKEARVSFGQDWARGSVADIFKRDIARHNVLLTTKIASDSLEDLEEGRIPKLQALKVFNGTMYHWNRACFGTTEGKAHLRIENRYLPAGPSVIDEMANFAFWVGLMIGRPAQFDHMDEVMDFKEAKSNFLKAARTGKESMMDWDGELISAEDLIIHKLLPIALKGLRKLNIDEADISTYLSIIKDRTTGKSGAQWQTKNYHQLLKKLKKDDALTVLTKEIYKNQRTSIPVAHWPMIKDTCIAPSGAVPVGNIMSTQLFVVKEVDLADLATKIMFWNNIHHLPVENSIGELVGLLTWSHLSHLSGDLKNELATVSDIMVKKPLTISPETTIREAIKLMKDNSFGCLPVVQLGVLIGIITIKDVSIFDHDKSV